MDGDKDPFPPGPYGNCVGDHGTCCAGEIAMAKNNDVCGVGVAYQSSITGVTVYKTSLQKMQAIYSTYTVQYLFK